LVAEAEALVVGLVLTATATESIEVASANWPGTLLTPTAVPVPPVKRRQVPPLGLDGIDTG
jgi:hypothetical protein